MDYEKKRWFTETRHVDKDTGEELSKSQVERERWVKIGKSNTYEDKELYKLNIHTNEYKKNRQYRLFE